MESKKQAIIKLFTQYHCLDNFDCSEIDQFAKCQDEQTLQKIFKQNEMIQEKFVDQFREILLGKAVRRFPVQVEVRDQVQYETPQQHEQNFLKTKRMELQDLLQATEQLRKMKQNFTYKALKLLELSVFIKTYPKLLMREEFSKQGLQIQQNLKPEIERLRQSMVNQGINNRVINDSFQKLEGTNDLARMSIELQIIKQQIIPIDIDQLNVLINKNKKSQSDVQGQSGIVFIGLAGAGKSTTVLGLLGHQMIKKQWQGQSWITPKKLKSIQGIQHVIANTSSNSVTRNVTAVQLPDQMMSEVPQQILLLDTPTFDDFQSSIIELANTFGAACAIKALKDARFVLIFSGKDQGYRDTGILKMIEIVNNLFPNYSSVKDSVIIIFNRYAEINLKYMKDILSNLWKSLPSTKQSNQNMKNIFDDFIQKTQNPKDILIFDPLNKSQSYAKTFVDFILEKRNNQDLYNNFQVCYGNITKRDIEKQTTKLRDYCIQYFQFGNYDVCKYFLSQLTKFCKILGGRRAPQIVQDSLKTIQSKINDLIIKKLRITMGSFNETIKTDSLTQKDALKYFEEIERLKDYRILQEYIKINDFESKMKENANDNIKLLVQSLKKQSSINEKTIKSLKVLVKYFEKEQVVRETKSDYEQQLLSELKNYQLFLKQGNFNGSVNNFHKYNMIFKNRKLFCRSEDQQNKLKYPINDIIIKLIEEKHNTIAPLLDDFSDLQPQRFNQIKGVSDYFIKLEFQSYEYLRTIANTNEVQQRLQSFKTLITSKVQDYWQSIEEYLAGKANLTEELANKIIRFYKQRGQMKTIGHLKIMVINKSIAVDNKIKVCLDLQRQIIEKVIDQIQEKKIIYNGLKKQIIRLDAAIFKIEKVLIFCQANEESILIKTEQKLFQLFSDLTDLIKQNNYQKLDLTKAEIHQHIKKLGYILEILLAFNIDNKKLNLKAEVGEQRKGRQDNVAVGTTCRRSKLLQSSRIADSYFEFKRQAQHIFQNYFKVFNGAVQKINAEGVSEHQQQKIKLKEIESCLEFIEMGKKIFYDIPEMLDKFIELDKESNLQISKWFQSSVSQIEKDFDEVTNSMIIPNLKLAVKRLKKSIQILFEITKYPLLQIKVEQNTKEYLEYEFRWRVSDMTAHFDAFVEKQRKSQIITESLKDFAVKCRILSVLDCFLKNKNYFEKLQKSVIQIINGKDSKMEGRFKDAFQNKQNKSVSEAIFAIKKIPEIKTKKHVKVVIAIDATASMASALKATRRALGQSFNRIKIILSKNKVDCVFEIQIVAYRNYDLKQKRVLETSAFENNPEPLAQFIESLDADGGWGNEALELAFSHCLEIKQLNQIIIITNAKPNTKQDTILKRKNTIVGYGQQYWKTTKFKKPLDCMQLFQKLKEKKITINSLPIYNCIHKYYQNLSKECQEKCELFIPDSINATTHIIEFISLSILNQIEEGPNFKQELAQSYKKMYKKFCINCDY